jgi:hypothetical protein
MRTGIERTLRLYEAQMEEIKKRTEVVECFVSGACTARYNVPTGECIALQIRKILELIALASLVANREEYARIHRNFAEHWRAKDILKEIEKVNPEYYPVPTKQIPMGIADGVSRFQLLDIESGFLTKDEFMLLYDMCSDLLHAHSPFSAKARHDAEVFRRDCVEWMNKIVKLLNHHNMHLAGGRTQIIALMRGSKDGMVHATYFEEADDLLESSERGAARGSGAAEGAPTENVGLDSEHSVASDR